jgi:hypothetical protein
MSGSGDISPEEQQARWLEEGKAVVKQQAFLMSSSLPLHPLCILCSHNASISPRTHISSYARMHLPTETRVKTHAHEWWCVSVKTHCSVCVCVCVCRYGGVTWSACLFLFASDAPLTACQELTQTP